MQRHWLSTLQSCPHTLKESKESPNLPSIKRLTSRANPEKRWEMPARTLFARTSPARHAEFGSGAIWTRKTRILQAWIWNACTAGPTCRSKPESIHWPLISPLGKCRLPLQPCATHCENTRANYDTSTCYMTKSLAWLKYACPRCWPSRTCFTPRIASCRMTCTIGRQPCCKPCDCVIGKKHKLNL